MPGSLEFEPDRFLLERLAAEHENGTWVGRELLPIAGAIREHGGDDDDYRRWVLASHLWSSYIHSTGDTVAEQERSLDGAWAAAARAKPWELEDALTGLMARVRSFTRWPNPRTASRDRAVALAFIGFCIEHNCFTRTISSYELAKYTPGMSQKSVHRALMALLDLGLLIEVDRTGRTSTRSTRAYRLFLRWSPVPVLPHGGRPGGNGGGDLMNTCKCILSQEPRLDTGVRDLWSRKGLGQGGLRVWEALGDETLTAQEISARTGQSERSVRDYAAKLADAGLVGIKPGRPARWFVIEDAPLDLIEEALGCAGHVDTARTRIEHQQAANRALRPSAYGKRAEPAYPDPFADAPPDTTKPTLAQPSPAPEVNWPDPDLTITEPGDSGDPTDWFSMAFVPVAER